MRAALAHLWTGVETADHAGLAYDVLAPVVDGAVPDEARATWLNRIARTSLPDGYASALQLWSDTLAGDESRAAEAELASRMLLGHGNASAIDVGLTLHATWGVPVIPGTALKGLLNHYVDVVLGPADAERAHHPLDPNAPADVRDRLAWKGVTWRGSRIQDAPGAIHRALFGSPAAESDDEWREVDPAVGQRRGLVVFHDAWMVPPPKVAPFLAVDVLTVHQKAYYDRQGAQGGPHDHDDPNPVGFLSVAPGTRFLIALSGPPKWTALAHMLLREALCEWGVGGKTSAGYGRIRPDVWRVTHDPERNAAALADRDARRVRERAAALAREAHAIEEMRQREEAERQRLEAEAAAKRAEQDVARRRELSNDTTLVELVALLDDASIAAKEKLARIKTDWVARLRDATPELRAMAVQRIQKKFDKPNVKALRDEVLALLA